MKNKKKIVLLGAVSLIICILFLTVGLDSNYKYVLSKRIPKLIAIILTGVSISFSSMVFQTITNNRILTPGVMGMDSIYIFLQTLIIFFLGSSSSLSRNNNLNFIISLIFMILVMQLLYKLMIGKKNLNILYLLLIGMVFKTFFGSLSSFMQTVIDPNEFQMVQDKMFASFNNINADILLISLILVAISIVYASEYINIFDVMALGREEAINLGVDYELVVKKVLVVIAILLSVSTALVGPITFLGLMVVSISREFIKSYKHSYLITSSAFIAVIALVGGQFIVERVMNFKVTIDVIINFIGGIYFIYLLLKESRSNDTVK
ncbi:MAG: iron chelate uptake ABC transporter family permease subunit [Inconstantimicrobium porci]|uniref:Iron chelate uptake ABC transporter family permease subunit n=1 Tax=Inconstantimicrobium porci TaxID=2652291 RepID=A0A7X2N0U0_9CLOT|nr:iron chelate uptake ABC transporter family permease subunit [Inconstantimicrobium porci]MDD6772325.1 iron chelate uptake ABC transporter family permease subunit [Inconstantimicrobium porci]MDY5911684.1 iron chelate uptake ABC transporter family permease subunit [Inconstantimicrobium porci]MSR92165.1 iron chelate uptake ABC transporter family permease subunit [Inconstantimicrobium porci]